MFSGIVEKSVEVLAIVDGPKFRRLTLACDWDDIRHGESIAVNGVCLTIAAISPGRIGFDAIAETLAKTNLGLIAAGDKVHVERALRASDRIDGHFVQGHVDGTARLVENIASESEWRLVIEPPDDLMKYIVPKGSVSIDGVSLTVAAIRGKLFEVALIPTTVAITQLASHPVGWPYNLETDVISKTIVAYLERREASDGG
jgi:riboflavin synthase